MAASGILNLNKPAGVTSRQVINPIQRMTRPAKVGHAGTLDPLATGVLVVCVGPATRLIEYVQRMPKVYRGTFLLGFCSPTDDVEGEVTALDSPPVPTRPQIEAAAARLVGQIQQRPPAYSALKVDGRRAYSLARRGQLVELKPRAVTIYRLAVVAYDYPALTLDVECSGGTYVRALGRDLAESLGTAAVMSALVRTSVGGFRLEDAIDPGALTATNWCDAILPPLCAVESLARIDLSDAEVERIGRGLTIPSRSSAAARGETVAVDAAGRLVAILTSGGPGLLCPSKNLLTGR